MVKKPNVKVFCFLVFNCVRISKYKIIVAIGYTPKWTNEIFLVDRLQPTVPVTYVINHRTCEILDCGINEHERSKTTVGDEYLFEKILQRKDNRIRVRLLGFDAKRDNWISKTDLI